MSVGRASDDWLVTHHDRAETEDTDRNAWYPFTSHTADCNIVNEFDTPGRRTSLYTYSRQYRHKHIVRRRSTPDMVEKESVLEGYEDVATTYAEERSPSQEEREALTSFLDEVPPNSRVLDAGCGGGDPVLRQLTDHSQQAIGLDFSTAQLELATSSAPGARLLCGDLTRLPLTDGSLDAVLAYHSLIHVPSGEHQTVIDEFARVLRPGGHLLVSEGPGEWQGTNPDWLDAGAEMQWYIAGAESTRAQLETAAFRIRHETGAPNTLADDGEATWVFFDATLAPESY